MRGSSTVSEELQRNYAHFGSKRREDGRIVWKRDPNLVKGFIPTELWDQVLRIRCPTIYILGGASTIVPPATQQKLRESLPAVQIVTMPKLGHYPHQEAPEDYLRIVQTFLAR
jgi:pimeloyl-ACP methyl ester carboxylesterase